jgi:hypothetical protein
MQTFIKLILACIIMTTVLTDKVLLHPTDDSSLSISSDKSIVVPYAYYHGEGFPVESITFVLPSMDSYDWQFKEGGHIGIILNQDPQIDISQSELYDLFALLSENYYVHADKTTLSFWVKEADQRKFNLKKWDAVSKIIKYLHQEGALFGNLLVLLDCESYIINGTKFLKNINFRGSQVDVENLTEVIKAECGFAEEYINLLKNNALEAVTKLFKKTFEMDHHKKWAEKRIQEVIGEVNSRIQGRRGTLLFLE